MLRVASDINANFSGDAVKKSPGFSGGNSSDAAGGRNGLASGCAADCGSFITNGFPG